MTDRFKFRWGIPEWDVGSTDIPNPILQYYSRVPWTDGEGKSGVGISNTEAMFILHLASFHFESAKGKSMPSLTSTLKERMGYKTNQGIINVLRGLEDKGLITVNRTQGRRSVYDFRPFSQAIMELWRADHSSRKVDGYSSRKVDDHPSTFLDPKKNKVEQEGKEEEVEFELDPSLSDEIIWEEPETSSLMEITVEKLSRTFGDFHHLRSNVAQAYNIWSQTSLGEGEFVAMLEEAAAVTKEAISKSQVRERNKRMAYYFAVLRDRLDLT